MCFYSAAARRNCYDQVRHVELRPKLDRHRGDWIIWWSRRNGCREKAQNGVKHQFKTAPRKTLSADHQGVSTYTSILLAIDTKWNSNSADRKTMRGSRKRSFLLRILYQLGKIMNPRTSISLVEFSHSMISSFFYFHQNMHSFQCGQCLQAWVFKGICRRNLVLLAIWKWFRTT